MTLQHVFIAKALSVILISATGSSPGFETGKDLMSQCSSATARAECLGYIRGTADTLLLYAAAKGSAPFCIPQGVTVDQMQDAVVTFLEKRQAQWHEGAAGLIFAALVKAWPCQSAQPPDQD
jgi:Rap1a immunity proteins